MISASDSEHKFYAHKYVLAKKSVVFAAMFKHDTIESKNKSINIEDITFEAMKELLRFIYTNDFFDITDSTYFDLIKAADKYQILDLKQKCESEIAEKLMAENAFQLLAVADQSNASILKENTIEFIISNAKTIVEKPEFNAISNLHVEVIRELFRKMAFKDG